MTVSQASVRPPLWVAPRVQTDQARQIRRVLIANRGEIACRVIKTCRAMGITSIAIYADEDAQSKHVADADEAINLGSMEQESGNPFLNVKLLIDTAVQARADAVHPGYGYLSENADFADAVRSAGIIFIGPSGRAMSTLGDKRQAKEYLAKHAASVPLIPGSTGSGVNKDNLEQVAAKIGFPIMIKASAGGGGKGMRVVREASALLGELERAQSEAQRSFGSSECILEKYIEAGKHVEVQIVGDSHGKVLSFWERDCSVQRRHQKIVEESPCTWLNQTQREAMCAVAVRIGELISYEGAGTVEFIVDLSTGKFYFLEVNARLQVEHPITEECTGVDLVSLQLFVASGGSLVQVPHLEKIPQQGHAIEVRLCAEDPARDFAPQHGLIRLWSPSSPASPRDVRFETAISTGARISIYFDPMIGKLVVWAPTRSQCIEMMAKTLADTICIGPSTNQLFLQSCLLHEAFRRPDYTTSFIPTNLERLLENPYSPTLGVPREWLNAIPGLCLRELQRLRGVNRTKGVFGTIRAAFRNQRYDTAGIPCDIVTTFDPKQGKDINPHVCLWNPEARGEISGYAAQVFPLPTLDETDDDKNPSAATTAYNRLTSRIRAGTVPEASQLGISIQKFQVLRGDQGTDYSSSAARFRMAINNQTLVGFLCIPDIRTAMYEADVGGKVKVIVHFPALGSSTEFHSYSMLSFFESMRQTIGGDAGGDLRTIKSPMPCKVLRVLKKNGDKVNKGEIVMVTESMKMEITIVAGIEGIFETHAKDGDAVDEGTVLCLLKQ